MKLKNTKEIKEKYNMNRMIYLCFLVYVLFSLMLFRNYEKLNDELQISLGNTLSACTALDGVDINDL